MRNPLSRSHFFVFALLALAPALAWAQTATTSTKRIAVTSYDRLFLGFVEDATIVDRQWWEASLIVTDADVIDSAVIGGTAVFQPWRNVEIGGRIGFGRTDTPSGVPDGRGATDMEAWGKYYLGPDEGKVDVAVGVRGIIPTGDNQSGLGWDAFALGFFGSARYNFSRVVLSGSAGFEINEDGTTLDSPKLDGETSARVGLAAIIRISRRINVVGEGFWAGERFDGTDDDGRLLGGVDWRLGKRGLLRGAISGGFTDGAPDAQLFFSYAYQLP